jgi:ubiquinone/menaquinone biosynthesis C-methylase UbiE
LCALGTFLDCWKMVGIDFAESLIRGAQAILTEYGRSLRSAPEFILGDAIAYIQSLPDSSVDCMLTERFLQNRPSRASQYEVIREAKRVLRPGGGLLMCEGSQGGFAALNDLRESVELSCIPASGPRTSRLCGSRMARSNVLLRTN